jgi:hypothetical protein
VDHVVLPGEERGGCEVDFGEQQVPDRRQRGPDGPRPLEEEGSGGPVAEVKRFSGIWIWDLCLLLAGSQFPLTVLAKDWVKARLYVVIFLNILTKLRSRYFWASKVWFASELAAKFNEDFRTQIPIHNPSLNFQNQTSYPFKIVESALRSNVSMVKDF